MAVCFSKRLDQTAKGWPPCLWAVAATTTPLKEAEKLTFGQPITVWNPHQVQTLVSSKGTEWLSPRKLTQVQAMLSDPVATIKTCHTLNPATLLPTEMGFLEQDRIESTDKIYSSHLDLGSKPLPNT